VPERPVILLVEESEDDSLLFERALTGTTLPFDVRIVPSYTHAQHYLQGAGQFADRYKFRFPKLIIADHSQDAFGTTEFLQWLRSHPECQVIPVILLTGTGSPSLIQSSYDLGIHAFFEKPAANADLQALLKLILAYWAKASVPASRYGITNN
jgi:CheY-like chemotaxis protein